MNGFGKITLDLRLLKIQLLGVHFENFEVICLDPIKCFFVLNTLLNSHTFSVKRTL